MNRVRTGTCIAARKVILTACILTLSSLATPGRAYAQTTLPIVKKVLVLNFDPVIHSEGDMRLHEVFAAGYKGYYWKDPRELVGQYITQIYELSHNTVRYEIVDFMDIDAFPPKANGLPTDEIEYLRCVRQSYDTGIFLPQGTTCDNSTLDYTVMLRDYAVAQQVNNGQIDELWFLAGMYNGGKEAVMVGPEAFPTQSSPLAVAGYSHAMHIMGFTYSRSVAEMLENFSHRIDGTMRHVFSANGLNFWSDYTRQSACGSVHYPPNATADYDWDNITVVASTCEDYLNYPALTGAVEHFACQRWGCTSLGYKRFWLSHIPHAPSVTADTWDTWWKYIVNYKTMFPPIPAVNTGCAGMESIAAISWTESDRGPSKYIANINDSPDNWTFTDGFWHSKYLYPYSTFTTTAPAAFVNAYNNQEPMPFLDSTKTYYVRMYYQTLGYRSAEVPFTPQSCPAIISPTPTPVAGDANGDALVNETDYGIWKQYYLLSTTSGFFHGDFNLDRKTDGIDFSIWLANVGL